MSRPSPPAEVVGLGVVVVDLLAVVDRYPQVDTKQDIRQSRIQVGGPVPTALAQLAKFGHRCHFISGWGDDPFGDVIEVDLAEVGMTHDRGCRGREVVTGHSQVWIEQSTGTRTSLTQRPDADSVCLTPLDIAAIRSASELHLDGWPEATALEAARLAKESGTTIVVDTGSLKPGIDELLSLADVVNAPRRFVEQWLSQSDLEQGAVALAALGPSIVTVTDGKQGSVMYAEDRLWRCPAFFTDQVVDTNGCGDVFTAGLIHSLLNRMTPPQMLMFATAAAGLKSTGLGNRESLPTASEVFAAAQTIRVR